MAKELLVVEREASGALGENLRAAGYACARAGNAQAALRLAEGGSYAAAVVDAELLGKRAPELIERLRNRGGFPVLAVAPEGGSAALVALLDAGAADYLTRPYVDRELAERVGVLTQRFEGRPERRVLRHKELELDCERYSAWLCGAPLKLTKQEYKILELMLLSPAGQVFSKQDFYELVWNNEYTVVDKTINVHICNIRKKIRAITQDAYIETIWGLGFRLV